MKHAGIVAALVTFASAAHAAPSADDVVAKVQTYYKKADHLVGDFHQEVTYGTMGAVKKTHGVVKLARPGKLRFDYAKTVGAGVKRSLRSDGKHLWDVEHDNLEIITKDISRDPTPVAVGVLTGTADLRKDFTPSLTTTSGFGDDKSVVVQLDPKQPSAQAKQVFIVVDPADGHIRETVVLDSSGNVNHVYFDKLDPRAAVKDSDFIVDPESKELRSYKLVDADKQAPQRDK